MEFNRGDEADELSEMRRRLVNYFRFDRHGQLFIKQALMCEVDVGLLLRCNPRNRNTWPPAYCYYAISNLYNLKVSGRQPTVIYDAILVT